MLSFLSIESRGVNLLAFVENWIKQILSPDYSRSTRNSNVSFSNSSGYPSIDPLVSITQIKSIGNLIGYELKMLSAVKIEPFWFSTTCWTFDLFISKESSFIYFNLISIVFFAFDLIDFINIFF